MKLAGVVSNKNPPTRRVTSLHAQSYGPIELRMAALDLRNEREEVGAYRGRNADRAVNADSLFVSVLLCGIVPRG